MEVRARNGDFDDRETAERVFRTLARSGLFADGSRSTCCRREARLGPLSTAAADRLHPEVLPPRCRISSW